MYTGICLEYNLLHNRVSGEEDVVTTAVLTGSLVSSYFFLLYPMKVSWISAPCLTGIVRDLRPLTHRAAFCVASLTDTSHRITNKSVTLDTRFPADEIIDWAVAMTTISELHLQGLLTCPYTFIVPHWETVVASSIHPSWVAIPLKIRLYEPQFQRQDLSE